MGEPIRVKEYISETGMEFLPNGMLIKSDTGMGATHLELICARHSIIVEPIRVTASSKVKAAKKDPNYLQDRLPFYVGSSVDDFPSPTDSDIIGYLENVEVLHKKFICVADSLPRVMRNIGRCGSVNTEDFFLLIDEVDSIQMDSSFRRAMEGCLDYYEKQPINMRAMLTATPLEFSNPLLKNEPITHFNLITSTEKPTFFVQTPNGLQCIIDRVEKITKSDDSKVVIVLNHIQSIRVLIEEFVKIGVLSENIAVLCSTLSKADFPKHFKELTDKLYPRHINFVTSAYYSGYDIEEDFHLICYANYRVQSTWLSPAQIKQIYGRCRKPFSIKSHMLVYRPEHPSDKWSPDYVTIPGLITEAQAVIDSEKCFNINYPKDSINNLGILKNFRAILVDALNAKKINSVRYNSDQSKLVISYFFIDSKVENYNTYETFYSIPSMPVERLKESGFQVTEVRYYNEVMLQLSQSEQISGRKFKLVNKLDELRLLSEEDIADELKKMEGTFSSIVNGRVLSFMHELRLFFPLKDVIDEAIDSLKGNDGLPCRDLRAFNNWLVGKYFQTTDNDTPIRIFVNHYFKVGDRLTSIEIATRMKDCIVHAQLKTLLGYESQLPVNIERNQKQLVTLAAKFVSFYRHRKKGGDIFRVLNVIPPKAPRSKNEIRISPDEMFNDSVAVDISTTFG
jgi:hypothetical protein